MIEEPVKYITKVEIQGLFGRYDIVWNLHPDVNVLAGINGSGKTTIIDCIHSLILEGVIPELRLNIINKIIITFNNKFEVCHPYIAKKNNPLPNLEYAYTNEEGKKIFRATSELVFSTFLSPITSDIISTFDSEAKSQETLQKVDKQVKTELDLELWLMQKEYMKYQIRISKTNSEINRATHTRFLAMIDELFSETHKKINSDKEELEFLLDDKEINTYQLSSGEKQLLVILLTVLVQDNKPAILLMDEPEISLHIEWQRKLIKYIRILNPNAQIIIATHSPDIIVHGWLDNVFNLQDLIVKDNTVL